MSKVVLGYGPVPAEIMIVGEAPGAEEEAQGKPFVGKSGQLLSNALQDAGINREACYITNVVKFRPEGNRTPTKEEVLAGWPLLVDELQDVQPKYILTLGAVALWALGDGRAPMAQAHGTRQARKLPGDPYIFACYHPAAMMYNPSLRPQFYGAINTFGEIVNGTYNIPGVG